MTKTVCIPLTPFVPSSVKPEDTVDIHDGAFAMSVSGTEFLACCQLADLLDDRVVDTIRLHRHLTENRYGLRETKALFDAVRVYRKS